MDSARVVLLLGLHAFAVACLPATVLADEAGLKLGKQVFLGQAEPQCAVCHTLADAKSAGEVGEDWDYQKVVKTIPAAEAFKPVDGSCTMS